MFKLLNANFYKLKKDKIFLVMILISFVLSLFAVYRYQSMVDSIVIDRIITEYMANYFGIIIAIFISVYVGKEYTGGTIRNKIISGHKRMHIYLANLIISIFAGLVLEAIYIGTVLLFGTKIYGNLQQLMSLGEIFLYTILIVTVYCSIYNLITMFCSDASIALVVCIILFVTMFVVNSIVSQKVNTSRYIVSTYYDEQGQHVIDKQPNPNYPEERELRIYKKIYFLIPTGQADVVHMACSESSIIDEEKVNKIKENLAEMPIYAVGLILVSNIVGLYFFKRQEIR